MPTRDEEGECKIEDEGDSEVESVHGTSYFFTGHSDGLCRIKQLGHFFSFSGCGFSPGHCAGRCKM